MDKNPTVKTCLRNLCFTLRGTPCLLDFPLANLDQTMFLPWLRPETAPVVDSQKEDSLMLLRVISKGIIERNMLPINLKYFHDGPILCNYQLSSGAKQESTGTRVPLQAMIHWAPCSHFSSSQGPMGPLGRGLRSSCSSLLNGQSRAPWWDHPMARAARLPLGMEQKI